MTLPNFLIIGAAKSGTSSLYMYLRQHPQIYMSPVKEPHFFSYDEKSKLTTGPGDFVRNAITDYQEYIHLFDGVNDEIAIGEASPTYLYREEAPQRIHDLIPDVKIICILRNPIKRAFSAYMHLVREGRETTKNFQEALAAEEKRKEENWGPLWHLVSVGQYYQQLKRYYDIFDRDKILVLLQEDLSENPKQVFNQIFSFLGVDPDFNPDTSVRHNITGYPKNKFINWITEKLFKSPNPIRWIARKVLPGKFRKDVTREIRQKNLVRAEIPQDLNADLIKLFEEDIHDLEKLINKDLSHWLV